MKSVIFISLTLLFISGCDSESKLFSPGEAESESNDAPQALNKVVGVSGAPVVQSVVELGTVSKPITVVTRDGGESLLIGGKILWTFGDTIL
jgi:hypothetical protein